MKGNALAAIHTRPNKLMGFELEPLSKEVAAFDLAPEFGDPACVLINREIAGRMIQKLQAFLEPSSRTTN